MARPYRSQATIAVPAIEVAFRLNPVRSVAPALISPDSGGEFRGLANWAVSEPGRPNGRELGVEPAAALDVGENLG
jgi:hypothetical protein